MNIGDLDKVQICRQPIIHELQGLYGRTRASVKAIGQGEQHDRKDAEREEFRLGKFKIEPSLGRKYQNQNKGTQRKKELEGLFYNPCSRLPDLSQRPSTDQLAAKDKHS